MSDSRIPVRVLGLSFNQIQSGAYALILEQTDGPVKIPIIIGPAEAQSVAMKLEGITPQRPLTHDLFVSFAHAFGVTLKEVFINSFADGIFTSELTFTDGSREVTLEARTSDAVAIALRTHTPIFTTREILDETGFILDASQPASPGTPPSETIENTITATASEPKLENYAMEELEKLLAKLIEQENYEEAARVSEIMRRKRGDK